jgi:hypothetical protein
VASERSIPTISFISSLQTAAYPGTWQFISRQLTGVNRAMGRQEPDKIYYKLVYSVAHRITAGQASRI